MTAPFRLVLAGQSLIERPVHAPASATSRVVRDVIRGGDLAVTNLEVAIKTRGGFPVRDTMSHVAPESVLDSLSWFGFGAVALASNHAFDLGPAGIEAALNATRRRAMIAAGTGLDASSATMAGVGMAGATRVALIAAVAAPKPPGAHALDPCGDLPARPGVNRLRVDERVDAQGKGQVVPDEGDVGSLLREVRSAARTADFVIAYLHNHYWSNPREQTPSWVRSVARRCVDEGASVVLGHGTPELQGFEMHRGHLIAYGLGSFVFHTHRPERYDASAWESVLVEVDLGFDGLADAVRLRPIIHGPHPDRADSAAPDGAPSLAGPDLGRRIISRLARLSAPFGVDVTPADDGGAILSQAAPQSAKLQAEEAQNATGEPGAAGARAPLSATTPR